MLKLAPNGLLLCLAPVFCLGSLSDVKADQFGWTVRVPARGMSFDSATGLTTLGDQSGLGLESVARRGDHRATIFWEDGGHRATVLRDGRRLIDGGNTGDLARIGGFRLDRGGSHIMTRKTKGPAGTLDLVQDGRVVASWPSHRQVQVLSYDQGALLVAIAAEDRVATQILRFPRTTSGRLSTDPVTVGELEGCLAVSARSRGSALLMEVLCDPLRGSDIVALDLDEGSATGLLVSDSDELFVPLRSDRKAGTTVLSVSGTMAARHAYHAVTASLLTQLGEPRARASDAIGTQSWGQSYRTLALAELYAKSGHPLFAQLARRAMTATLQQRNAHHGLTNEFNPSCGWASRLYSTDRRSPVSLLVNQGMIAGSLLLSCERLGGACSQTLRLEIEQTARCLAEAYEPNFDRDSGLYRIQYGGPFRFDGIWAPWNWQTVWAVVLDRAGRKNLETPWRDRAQAIASAFLNEWQSDDRGALWRYWPEIYYRGWTTADRISVNKVRQAASEPRRFEDVSHAGISLFALQALPVKVGDELRAMARARLDYLLGSELHLPRYIDGAGGTDARMFPSTGWHAFAQDAFVQRYAHKLPGASSGDQHLTYALLFDPDLPFDLRLTVQACRLEACEDLKTHRYGSLDAFLDNNPLFQLEAHSLPLGNALLTPTSFLPTRK